MEAQVAGRWLARAVDRFVPPEILAAPEPARRARFAVALSWISTALFVLALGVQGPMNTRGVFLLNLVSAVGSAVAPFVLRRTGRTTMVCNAVLAMSFVKYLVIIAFWRGAGLTGATVLLSQLPLAATFLMGLRVGAVWAILSTVAGIVVAVLGRAGVIVDHLPPAERLFNDHFVLVISTAILFTIAWLYEHMKDAAQRQIYELEASRQAAELERVQAVSRSQLAEAQRLAALGQIAAATAHEINSPLLAVVANLEYAVENIPAGAPADFEASLRDSLGAAQRIGAIVAEMNRYAEPPDADGTPDVAEAVASTGARLDILIIDDDEAILSTLKRVLAAHTVTIAAGGHAALDILAAHDFDLILCDLMMPDLTGMDIFDKLSAPHTERIVFMTGGTFTERAEAFRRGVTNAFLEKPFDLRTLRRLVDARAALTTQVGGGAGP